MEYIGTFIDRLNQILFRRYFFNYDFREPILLTSSRWRDEQLREPTEFHF